jgi:hypothetical protein
MSSGKNTPRLLGAAFLFVVVASALSGLLHTSLGVTLSGPPDDISETMIRISDSPIAMQTSIVGYLVEAVAIVLLAVLLYTTLEEQNRIAARWALGLWIGEAVILAIREISLFSLLDVSQEFVKAGAPDSSYFHTLGSLFYGTFQFGYGAQMVFYCTGGVLFYYLFLRSKYVPRVLSLVGIAAASLAFVGELLVILGYDVPLYVFLPILPFELAIGGWLMVVGFDSSAIASDSAKTDVHEIE